MKRALLILLILSPLCLFSQKTNSGTEFWMAFMKNYDSSYSGKKDSLRLYISATSNATVTVSIPLQSYSKTISVPKDSVIVFLVPLHLGYIRDVEVVVNKAIHITSDFPISVAAMNMLYATTDASIVLPYANIPRNTTYVAGNPSGHSQNLIMLVAGEDSTKIEIIPNAITYSGYPRYVPFRITLNKGQVYQLGNSTYDLSGTIIKVLSQNKLVAFNGDQCSNWPCGACDHQYEQILPNDVIDTAYCIPSHFGHTKGYLIKMVPLDTNTDIRVNGFTYKNVSRKNPLVIDVKGDSGYFASSSKLFHCHQFLKGAGCSGYINSNYGDPSQLELVSTKYFGESALFSTVNSFNLQDHFVNVVIKTSAKNNVYLDKTKIDSSEFTPFQYAKEYSFAKIKILTGQHLVESSDGLLAYCYGVGFYESYLYLAGFSLPNFDLDFSDSVIAFDCKNKKITVQFTAKSEKKLKKYSWTFGDNTKGTGNPVQHLYSTTGIYTVKLVGEDFNGKKDSITKKVKVDWPDFDPVRNKIICGIDTVTFIEKNPFFSNFKWQDNSTKNYYKAWTNKYVKVIATDTSGYCKFSDSGSVAKIDIFSNIKVDSIEKCWKYNRFNFKDSTKIFADDILHRAWVFPWKTVWDTSQTEAHFPMPGKYKVYFDIYTTQANCKARYPIDVVVNPMPKVFPKVKGDLFCSNTPILFYDSSQVVTGFIKKVKWLFDDASSVESDSLKTFKKLAYIPSIADVIRFYNHIAITDRNCSDTALNAVLVWPKPKADFTLTNPDTIQCLPFARWTYNSTSTVDADSMSLYWDAGNGRKSTNYSMKNIRYFNPGRYKVKLKAVSTFGCVDSIVKTVEAVEIPKADFYINDSMQCFKGHTFTFSDTSTGKFLNYFWSLGNGNTSTKPKVDDVRYTTAGSYNIKLKINSIYPGCNDSITRQIHILKSPQAFMKIEDDTQCLLGNSFKIQNTSIFYQRYKATRWTAKNIADTNFNITPFALKDTGNFILNLAVMDTDGCADTTYGSVRITALPAMYLIIKDSLQCFSNKRFVFRTTSLKNEINRWYINNQLNQSGTVDSVAYNEPLPGLHTISLARQTVNGCRDSISKTYRLLEALKPGFKVNKDSQCFNGHNFDFTDISIATNDKITDWKYLIDQQLFSGQQNISNITFPMDGVKNTKLVIITKEGCTDSISDKVTVYADPVGTITGDTVCLYEEATITGTQTSGQTISNWDWQLGDGNTSNTRITKHTYNNTGKYSLTLNITDIQGCVNTINIQDGVIVHSLPDATFNYVKSDVGVNQCYIKFTPQQSFSNTYFWQYPDGSISHKDTPSILLSDLMKGDIILRVTSQYGCVDSSIQSIYVFPNNFNVFIPGAITVNDDNLNDIFKIEGLTNAKDFSLKVINRWGEEIFYSTDASSGWDGRYKGAPVQEGIYMYLINFSYYDGKTYEFRGTVTVLK